MIDAADFDRLVGVGQASLTDHPVKRAMENVQRRLDDEIIAAFRRGKDYVALPPQFSGPPDDLTQPATVTVSVQGGAVEPGHEWPRPYRVYRVRDLTPEMRERFGI